MNKPTGKKNQARQPIKLYPEWEEVSDELYTLPDPRL